MPDHGHPFSTWESFYVIVGSSGAALIGLQFIVITLIAEMRPRASIASVNAFGTPTVVHLGSALVISCLMSAPWASLPPVAWALTVLGFAGVVYSVIITRRARNQSAYVPVLEDWIWHVILPCAVYVTLALAALSLSAATSTALFVIGGVALVLLLIGIHNAWDTVIYLVLTRGEDEKNAKPVSSPPETQAPQAVVAPEPEAPAEG